MQVRLNYIGLPNLVLGAIALALVTVKNHVHLDDHIIITLTLYNPTLCMICDLFSNQEFLDTLDADLIKRLARKAYQRGIGSMDYINSMMVTLYDDDDDDIDHPAENSG